MSVTLATIQNIPLRINQLNPATLGGHRTTVGTHHRYYYQNTGGQTSMRTDDALTVLTGQLHQVSFTLNGGGNCVYLPFHKDEIHSISLPTAPGLNDPTLFMTANLDGCSMLFEKRTNEVVVYHANFSTGVSPTKAQTDADPAYQTPAMITAMTGQMTTASTHYAGAGAITQVKSLWKSEYFAPVRAFIQRKKDMGRTDVEYIALTTVAGFYQLGHWEFWFQTAAYLHEYVRPMSAPKAWPQMVKNMGTGTEARKVRGDLGTMQVLQATKIATM